MSHFGEMCFCFFPRHHTLVLTESGRVYSFGSEEQGQLGHGVAGHSAVPLPVQLPPGGALISYSNTSVNSFDCKRHSVSYLCFVIPGSDGSPTVGNIFAGENCSFATRSTKMVKIKSDVYCYRV